MMCPLFMIFLTCIGDPRGCWSIFILVLIAIGALSGPIFAGENALQINRPVIGTPKNVNNIIEKIINVPINGFILFIPHFRFIVYDKDI